MAVPTPPTAGEPIAEAWGDVVHNSIVAQDFQSGGPVPLATTAVAYGTGWGLINFPRPFASAPMVVATNASGSGLLCATVRNVTASSFEIGVTRIDGSAVVATGQMIWHAYGPRA